MAIGKIDQVKIYLYYCMAENNLQSPHDRFFRVMMTDHKVIREFFTQNLPANIRKIINFNSISLEKDSFIDDHLRLQIADLLYSAEFDNQPGYLYLLVEHQTAPCQLMPFRLLKYIILNPGVEIYCERLI